MHRMNAHWWCNKATEMHILKLSMGLERQNFDKINNGNVTKRYTGTWLARVCSVTYKCIWEVAKHSRRELHLATPSCDSYTSLTLSNLFNLTSHVSPTTLEQQLTFFNKVIFLKLHCFCTLSKNQQMIWHMTQRTALTQFTWSASFKSVDKLS